MVCIFMFITIQKVTLADCQRRLLSQDARFFEIAHAVIVAPEVKQRGHRRGLAVILRLSIYCVF